jgi:hypothetical protein
MLTPDLISILLREKRCRKTKETPLTAPREATPR